MKPLKLPAIHVPKTSDVLARELRRQILSGALPTGASLPPERDLVAQTGLSRSSVREALRILESESLVTTKPGRFGGSVASQPGDESIGRSLSHYVHGRGITLLELMQTREAVEPSLTALAAENRTGEELQELRAATERVEAAFGNLPVFLHENVNWHLAIAAASHNHLLRAILASIASMVYKATAMENFATEEVRKQVMQAHRRILEGIVKKDAGMARRRMERHLAAVTAAVQAFPNAPLVLDF
jgi:GntR family transcriptional regulator, transcriptional repressor for pyruvate dehydrogenase complex